MKIWKIICGVLSILLGAFLFYESSQVQSLGILAGSLGVGVNKFYLYVGFIVSIIYILIGIFAVLKYNQKDKNIDIAIIVAGIVAFILSFMGPKIFEDLLFCSAWAVVCVVTAVVSIIMNGKEKEIENMENVLVDSLISDSKMCPNCGAQISEDSLFCTECGKKISRGKSCPHCGAPMNDDDAFCQNCGKKPEFVPVAYQQPQHQIPSRQKSSGNTWLYVIIGLLFIGFVGMGVFVYFNLTDKNKVNSTMITKEDAMNASNVPNFGSAAPKAPAKASEKASAPAAPRKQLTDRPQGHYSLDGKIHKYGCHLDLDISGNGVSGSSYYHSQGSHRRIYLSGTIKGQHLEIYEHVNGEQTGYFEGTFNGVTYEGTFVNFTKMNPLTFKFIVD